VVRLSFAPEDFWPKVLQSQAGVLHLHLHLHPPPTSLCVATTTLSSSVVRNTPPTLKLARDTQERAARMSSCNATCNIMLLTDWAGAAAWLLCQHLKELSAVS
jgi:hypothetical protein